MQEQRDWLTILNIYDRLCDEESKHLFKARIQYLSDHDQGVYMDHLYEIYDDWHPLEQIKHRLSECACAGIIVFGCGYGGQGIRKLLQFWDMDIAYYCDNKRCGQTVDGVKVLSLQEVTSDYTNYLVIIGSYEYSDEMYGQLLQEKFPEDYIWHPESRILMGSRGKQYFDVFEPLMDGSEVFVDAGAYDGQTTLDFIEWTGGNYTAAYTLEPIKEMCPVIQRKLADYKNISIIQTAAWKKKEWLYFDDDKTSSCMTDNGALAVPASDIDSIVGDESITFIKMDIEGCEMSALEGAKKTILRDCPRLAICIYHKDMDVIDIASYLMELVPDYKFYIRHYTSHMWETVLYAVR